VIVQVPLPQSIPLVHWQLLLTQLFPGSQTFPHVPQLFESVVGSTQTLPHSLLVGAVQVIAQLVPLHDAAPLPLDGPGQAAPQTPPAPQPLEGLGAWHTPPQSSLPAGHAHWPLWHDLPPEHAVVQLPQ
jgi:hypothetical protein